MIPYLLLPSLSFAQAPPPVTGGTKVADGDWPSAAAVYFNYGGRDEVGCSGVLVAPTVVLTAAHCVDEVSTPPVTQVFVGGNNLRQLDEGEVIEVIEQIKHPDYTVANHFDAPDIGILILAEPSTIEPIVVAQDCILENDLYDGALAQVVGYGAIDEQGRDYPDDLYEGTAEITDADCSDLQAGCSPSISPGGELIAGGNPGVGGVGVDSCYGDSGGPLYLWSGEDAYLIGLTSRAKNGVRQPCGEGGIYTRVDAMIDWIESETGVTLPAPSCGETAETGTTGSGTGPGDTGATSGDTGVAGGPSTPAGDGGDGGTCGCGTGLPPSMGWAALAALGGILRRRRRPPRRADP